MKKVLILGAGMVVRPMARYLLDKGFFVTIASRTKSKAEAILSNHPNSQAIGWTVDQEQELDKMIQEHDLVVSLLPYAYHVMVAKKAIKHKKNMVTTSYVKPEMRALDEQAKQAGILILNEVGLDPGIDHMSAMRIIDHIHSKGGKVEEFYSLCGALPAPEVAEQNPFRYKFSWSPKGVIMAGNNDGRYLKKGKQHYTPPEDLFKDTFRIQFPNVGELEVYPNRDSLPYIDLYGIPETKTMFRGTLRYPGWCETMDAMKTLGLFTDKLVDATNLTYAQLMLQLINSSDTNNVKEQVAKYLNLSPDAYAINAMEWLGLFSDKIVGRKDTLFEIISDLMIEKLELKPDERDMVVMMHLFLASYPDGSKEVIKSWMLDFGTLKTDTSVARTVSLPAAVAVRMILENKINITGVHIPVIPELYNPILDALEEMDIKMNEQFGLPEDEINFEK